MNPITEILEASKSANQIDREAKNAGWKKSGRKGKKSAVELGAKHAARVQAQRLAKQQFGNGLAGGIAALLARTFVNSTVK